MRLNLEVRGLDKVETDVEGRANRLLDLTPAYRDIVTDLRHVEAQAFETQGASTGRQWAPNAPWWAFYKRKHYATNYGVLEMGSGRLLHSLTVANAPYSVSSISRQSMVFGTSLGIAKILERGGYRPVKDRDGTEHMVKIPGRPFLRSKAADRKRWAGFMEDHVAGEPRRGGGM